MAVAESSPPEKRAGGDRTDPGIARPTDRGADASPSARPPGARRPGRETGNPTVDRPEDAYPLTPLQQGLLSHALDARPGVYLLQMVGELREPVDAGAMRRAWQRAADRHEVLRTGF